MNSPLPSGPSAGPVRCLRFALVAVRHHHGLVKLKLDLHDIYERGDEIDRTLRSIMDEAVAKKASLVESSLERARDS
jgi:hypothetical protein